MKRLIPLLMLCGFIFIAGCTAPSAENKKDLCPTEVDPICAKVEVQCIQAPCPPVEQTYNNLCEAKQAGATIVHSGKCKEPREKAREILISQVEISTPVPGTIITSPLVITGYAPGTRFFEGSAPVVLYDGDGIIIAMGYVTAQMDWMTEQLVPFSGMVEYTLQGFMPSNQGTLVLKRDNASGLPEHDAEVEVEVRF